MRIALLALALLPTAAAAAPTTASARQCANAEVHKVNPAGPLQSRKLDREPAAEQYLGVLHLQDGCDTPIKVQAQRGARP